MAKVQKTGRITFREPTNEETLAKHGSSFVFVGSGGVQQENAHPDHPRAMRGGEGRSRLQARMRFPPSGARTMRRDAASAGSRGKVAEAPKVRAAPLPKSHLRPLASGSHSRFQRSFPSPLRFVGEVRCEPFFHFGNGHSFALGVVFHLVALDFADGEIFGFGMREVESAHRTGGHHGQALGQ